jgi:2-C-methyl-D-erythritol 4-phosphate cytidylyltransferase
VHDVVNAAIEFGGAIPCLPARDTIKVVKDGFVQRTLDRSTIYMAHTPQVFRRKELIEAMNGDMAFTDEASAYEHAGHAVKIVLSSPDNIKITQQEDIPLAEILVKCKFPVIADLIRNPE